MPATDYLTPQEAASELRVSLGTIYTLIREHRVPVHRIGSQYRLSRVDVANATRQETPGFFGYVQRAVNAERDRRP